MAELIKFMFDIDFGEQLPPPVVEEEPEIEEIELPPPPPTYSEDELATAKDEAYTRGKLDGLQEARSGTDSQTADLLSQIASQIAHLDQAQLALHQRTHEDAVALATAVAKKMMPTFVQRHGVGEMQTVLEACLTRMADEPRTIVRVHPQTVAQLAEPLAQLTARAGIENRVTVIGDELIEYGDCRVEWSNGGVERDTNRLSQEIDDVIAQNASSSGQKVAEEPEPAIDLAGNQAKSALDILAEDIPTDESAANAEVVETHIKTDAAQSESENETNRQRLSPTDATNVNPGDTDG